jgi:hypothetical protein
VEAADAFCIIVNVGEFCSEHARRCAEPLCTRRNLGSVQDVVTAATRPIPVGEEDYGDLLIDNSAVFEQPTSTP